MADLFDYRKAHATAARLISKFGQPANVIKKGNASGWEDNGDPIPVQPDIVINGMVTPLLQYKQSEIDGEHVLVTDSYVFFESSIPPEIDMMITINSQQFRIENLKTLESVDDINIYRRLQLRK